MVKYLSKLGRRFQRDRNAKLEREAAAIRAARSDAPPSQPNKSTRRPYERPRGSRTRRHGEILRGDNYEILTNP
uniref:Uncharacterized protein n=1 Tax=Cannabis sativa TaxID=3483 RepID=A0A803NTU8_CANSA